MIVVGVKAHVSRHFALLNLKHKISSQYISASFQEDARFKQALKVRNPKNRLKRIYDACKSKKKCAGGDDIDVQGQQDSEEPTKKSKGGCGAQQPNITIDGMKMVAEYKAPKKKSDDQEQLPDPVERKQILSAERVHFLPY